MDTTHLYGCFFLVISFSPIFLGGGEREAFQGDGHGHHACMPMTLG